ncbi:TetR/AcrR family transcriptional regulator [Streptomyces durbertensis]|uniref:TetR/AcrR family transcriptional regulator n=1 Tax=Streptomyces durbertensis TaxID=2448886 RepID=A0ABR6EIU6_9ACTN|nr:TetR/AcrR family transcriptional regulator [Streptomyces durbertensis]MBB1245083.1 TetR/AcrR family transcriptional regulator [Streptomyces durbertensis]
MTVPAYRRLSVEQRRSQLLSTALRLFARLPPEEVSLEDVASEAGVSRPLVYRYFPGGKQQLYEAALRSAADELEQCFDEPHVGPLTDRLARALGRYMAFIEEHDAGFTALLRGGSVVETSRTSAIVDEVRRQAAAQILSHLVVEPPGPRLSMTVRTWISSVEAASLIWLDEGKQLPRTELRDLLLDQLMTALVATGARDEQTAGVVRLAAEAEGPDGRLADLARRVVPVVAPAAHLL